MGPDPIENQRVIVDVQRLLSTVNTKATANVVSQTYRNRRSADKVVVCMGGTSGVVVDLDRCEKYALQLPVGTHLVTKHADQPFASCGFRVYKGTSLVVEANANTLSRHGLPSRLHHLSVNQLTEDVVEPA